MFNRTAGIVLIFALVAGLGLWLAQKSLGPDSAGGRQAGSVQFYPTPRELPDFSLSQPDGTRLIPGELRGHWTLVFLGYTSCPDVCPTTLAELAQAQKQWESIPESLRPRVLFVSVDPQRDTLPRLGEYAHAFHKDTLAATADEPALERFAAALGLVFMKSPGRDFAKNPNDYSMDHSASIAVLDPDVRLAGIMRPPFNPQVIARDFTTLTRTATP